MYFVLFTIFGLAPEFVMSRRLPDGVVAPIVVGDGLFEVTEVADGAVVTLGVTEPEILELGVDVTVGIAVDEAFDLVENVG